MDLPPQRGGEIKELWGTGKKIKWPTEQARAKCQEMRPPRGKKTHPDAHDTPLCTLGRRRTFKQEGMLKQTGRELLSSKEEDGSLGLDHQWNGKSLRWLTYSVVV